MNPLTSDLISQPSFIPIVFSSHNRPMEHSGTGQQLMQRLVPKIDGVDTITAWPSLCSTGEQVLLWGAAIEPYRKDQILPIIQMGR